MDASLRAELGRLTGQTMVRHEPRSGGSTSTSLWRIELGDGGHRFVKVAADQEAIAGNRTEAAVLAANASPRLARFEAISHDGSVLITEDLSGCDWEPGLGDPARLSDAIGEIAELNAADELFVSFQGSGRNPWGDVLGDDRFAPAVGVHPAWLDRHGEALAAAALAADTSGDRLLHGDLAPGNWCRDPAVGWRFVDWASAHRGNPCVDHAIASIRLTRELGRPCATVPLRQHPDLAAFIAGRFATELLDVDWSGAPSQARVDRMADIRAGLALAAHLLDLADPYT